MKGFQGQRLVGAVGCDAARGLKRSDICQWIRMDELAAGDFA